MEFLDIDPGVLSPSYVDPGGRTKMNLSFAFLLLFTATFCFSP